MRLARRVDLLPHDRHQLAHPLLGVQRIDEPSTGARSGIRPWLIRCALVMIRLSAAWRKISVSLTTGTAPEAMMSPRTCPGPTEGS
jgi:hypothetical protein